MYRVYLRNSDGRIIGEVSHPATAEAALEAFSALINRTQYDGFAVTAVLIENNDPIAVHRFDRTPAQSQFWRRRRDRLALTTRH